MKAILYDLDNTIYPVPSIGDRLFAPIYEWLRASSPYAERIEIIKDDLLRKPFQVVAQLHGFSPELTEKGIDYLSNCSIDGPIEPFDDYPEIRKLTGERFLITTGFLKLQQSKITCMGIGTDFKEVHIIDPMTTRKTKKDIFRSIADRYGYTAREMLVVGDDPDSEIRAAGELGIDSVLVDRYLQHPDASPTYRVSGFVELTKLFSGLP